MHFYAWKYTDYDLIIAQVSDVSEEADPTPPLLQ